MNPKYLLLIGAFSVMGKAHAAVPTLEPDMAGTDDQTPILIDVLANDHGSNGQPMILTDARAQGCPGVVTFHTDGTVELDPDPVTEDTHCRIDYDVQIGDDVYGSFVDLTVTKTGLGGDPDYLGVPTVPYGGCVNYGTQPPSAQGQEQECCWRELLRAVDGQQDLDWDAIDVLKVQANAANKRLLCRAADYFSEPVRPSGAGLGQPDSRNWFLNDLTRMSQEGWMDDGGGGHGSNEILSPLYGTWHLAAYLVALDRARNTGDAALVQKLEGWLRTYWVMNTLTAHAQPILEATTETTWSCGAGTSHTVTQNTAQWNGLSIAPAGTRNLGECDGGPAPQAARTGIFHPGNFLTSMALDWFPRASNGTGLGTNNYHYATRTVLLLEGRDFFAAGNGTLDLEEFQPPASRFGLTEYERDRLADFVASPTTDVNLFQEILSFVERDDPWRPAAGCPMTFLRTTEATLSRFGVDGPSSGDWLPACNRNKPPMYAAVAYDDGRAFFLSPGNTQLGPYDGIERRGESIVAGRDAPGASSTRSIARPGGDLIYRIEWSWEHGLQVIENYPDPPIQDPYGGLPHGLPGRVEAEHFDLGGSTVAWSDSTPDTNNAQQPFRPEEGVDIETFSPSRIAVIDVAPGEWLEYTVDVAAAGDYALSVEYRGTGGGLRFQIPGTSVDGHLSLPAAADWRHAHLFDLPSLLAGEQIVRLTVIDPGFELDAFRLSPLGEPRGPYGGTAQSLPGDLEAEHYDEGDPQDAYSDTTPFSAPDAAIQFRGDDWVDAQIGTRTTVSWIEAGEWLEYTVWVTEADEFDVDIHYQSEAPGRLNLTVFDGDGQIELTRLVGLPATAGEWRIETITELGLTPGAGVLRIDFEQAVTALDKLVFSLPIDIDPVPPVAVNDYLYVPQDAVGWVIPHSELLANDAPAGIEIDWQYAELVPGAFFGSLSFTETAFLYTPPANWQDQTWFRYRIRHPVTDETNLGIVFLRPINGLPVANDDHLTLLPGSTVTIYHSTLFANDDGQSIVFDGVETYPAGALQEHHHSLVYTAPSTPTTDSFTYRLRDTYGNVAPTPATVHLMITDQVTPPTANNDLFYVAQKRNTGGWVHTAITNGVVQANDTLPDPSQPIIQSVGDASCGDRGPHQALGWNFTVTEGCDLATWSYRLVDQLTGLNDTAQIVLDVVPAPVGGADAFRTDHQRSIALSPEALTANDETFGLGAVLLTDSLTTPEPVGSGTLSFLQGTVVLTPADGFVGDVTFTYQIRNDMPERNPISFPATWDITSEPITVTVTVDPPDVSALDDSILVASGHTAVDIALDGLWINDQPAATELELVSFTQPSHGHIELILNRLRFEPSADFWAAGEDQLTYTVRRAGGTGWTSSATVRLEAEPFCPDARVDDFESGSLGGWAQQLENGGTLSVTGEAAMQGSFGLKVDLQAGATVARLGEIDLWGSAHPRISFWFDPGSIDMAEGEIHPILASGQALFLSLSKAAGTYRLNLVTRTDTEARGIPWVDLTTGPHHLVVEAAAAGGPDRRDGYARLWIDGVLRGEMVELDNHGLPARVGYTLLGGLWGLGATEGAYFFDDYRSCHGPESRDAALVDGFEDLTLDAWTTVMDHGPGSVSITPEAALEGGRGLSVSIDPGTSEVKLRTDSVHSAERVVTEFLLDPGSLSMADGQDFFLSGFSGLGGWRHHLRLGSTDGKLRIRQIAKLDGGGWSSGPWHDLAGAGTAQRIAVEWWQASRPGAADGGARLVVDGLIVDERLGLDNDEQYLRTFDVGAAGAVDPGTSGTFFVDSVQIWRGIGTRSNLLDDEFEPDLAADWQTPVESGGTVSTQGAAAITGWKGLEMSLTPGGGTLQLKTDVAAGAEHLGASFRFDPASFTMAEGQRIYLFGGSASGGWPFHVRLRYSGGLYQLRLFVDLDDGTWLATQNVVLNGSGQAQNVAVEWWRATTVGAADGGARLSLDGALLQELAALDNHGQMLQTLHLGVIALAEDPMVGSLYFDDVHIWTVDD